jgi:hypothetical protein
MSSKVETFNKFVFIFGCLGAVLSAFMLWYDVAILSFGLILLSLHTETQLRLNRILRHVTPNPRGRPRKVKT